MALQLSARNMVVIVIAAAACASVASSSFIDKDDDEKFLERGVNVDEKTSQKLNDAERESETVRNVTTTITRHEKKMIHRLIGGHVKLYSGKTTSAKDQRETPPTRSNDDDDDDDGLLMSSAGNGKEKTSSSTTRRGEDDEEKKSLSQQVKEGKYGLIQNEIYKTPPKRPGIISYLGNPEVPKDTAKNLGGLEEEEIWLAENHLLVLRGGNFPVPKGGSNATRPESNTGNWPPIDDYKAPERQVKIPPRPKVPPPFPVQLTEGGPVQIIRANGSVSLVNDTADYEEYANYPEGFYPGEAPFYPTSSSNASEDVNAAGFYGNGSEGVLGPFYHSLPAGAVFVPPPSNQTEDYDEEDQSIYYPPPYSFYYPQDNATAVPPGPLVPGIILPPPPNFFAELDDRKPTTKGRFYAKQTTTTPRTTTTTTERVEETTSYTPPVQTPRRKTVSKPYKARFPTTTPSYYSTGVKSTTRVQGNRGTPKTIGKVKSRNFTRVPIAPLTSTPFVTPRYVETTTAIPEKPSTTLAGDYNDVQSDVENHLIDLGPPQGGQWSAIVSSTAVPLLAYYATTPLPSERTRSTDEDVAPVHVKAEIDIPTKNPAAYYFYEETNGGQVVATTTPSPYYDVQPIPRRRQPKKQYYSVEMVPSQQTADDIADLKISTVIKTGQGYKEFNDPETLVRNPAPTAKYNVERIRGSVGDRENSPRYYNHNQPLPATVKPYYTTQRPRFYYQSNRNEEYADYRDDQEVKSSPVYQYSYEASDYTKQRQRQSYREQEIDEVPTPAVRPVYNEYRQPTRTASDQYYNDYDVQPVEKTQKSSGISYRANQRQAYSAATARPLVNATPNPHHAYYTKQDEQLLDDVTKQYFTIFGKKLPENVIQSTTPLYRIETTPTETTTESPVGQGVNTYVTANNNRYNVNGNNAAVHQLQSFTPPKVSVHYGDQTQRPYSLEGDTLVNYKNPLPPINPDAEFIPVNKHYAEQTQRPYSLEGDTLVNYKNPLPPINPDAEFITVNKPVTPIRQRLQDFRNEQISSTPYGNRNGGNYLQGSNHRETSSYTRGRYPPTPSPISLANDISVNYRDPRPPINPDAEFIDPLQGQRNQATRGGSYFAYQLPGNGGHFYFLTPQAISQRQDLTNGGYFYSKPTATRLARRRRRGPAEG